MSIECGECERDLRGCHDEDCSRNPINKAGERRMNKFPQDICKVASGIVTGLCVGRGQRLGFHLEENDWLEAEVSKAILAERERWIGAASKFKSGGDWGSIKAWLIHGPPPEKQGMAAVKQITEWQVAIDKLIYPGA
jgi:hypothetical protein